MISRVILEDNEVFYLVEDYKLHLITNKMTR